MTAKKYNKADPSATLAVLENAPEAVKAVSHGKQELRSTPATLVFPKDVEAAATLIRAGWNKTIDGLLETAAHCKKAAQTMSRGELDLLYAKLPFDESTFSKLKSIGECEHFYHEDVRYALPISVSKIYGLRKVDPVRLKSAIVDGVLNPALKRDEVENLAQGESSKDENPEGGLPTLPTAFYAGIHLKESIDMPCLEKMVAALNGLRSLDGVVVVDQRDLTHNRYLREMGGREKKVMLSVRKYARQAVRDATKHIDPAVKPKSVPRSAWVPGKGIVADKIKVDAAANKAQINRALKIVGFLTTFEELYHQAEKEIPQPEYPAVLEAEQRRSGAVEIPLPSLRKRAYDFSDFVFTSEKEDSTAALLEAAVAENSPSPKSARRNRPQGARRRSLPTTAVSKEAVG
jgi:hypothetical protein